MANIVDITMTIDDHYQWDVRINNIAFNEKSMTTLLTAINALKAVPQCFFDLTINKEAP